MVTSASVAFAYNQHQSTFYYAERQAAWLLIGFVALFVLARIDYRRIRPLAPAGAVAAALLMLLVLIPHLGVSVNGARRWFDAGPLGTFQPSELGKLAFAVFIAHWIDRNSHRMGQFQQVFVPFAAMLAGVLVLLMLERDLGTAIVTVGIFLSAFWAGGGRLRHIILLVAGLGLGFIAVTLLEPYRMARLTAFKNPWADPLGAGFQAFLTMATVTTTLPITGVPLPFFSYGGTALATTLAAVGLLLSIARRGSGSALRNNRQSDETFDRGRRNRRTPVSGARGRASVPR